METLSPEAVASERPHVLYVAWGYPPSRGAGMYRALATGNAFVAAGWDVTVLTATRDTFVRLTGSDPEAETAIDPAVRVVRIPFDQERGERDLSRWSRFRVSAPLLWNYLRWMRSRAAFPEGGYGHWKAPLTEAAERIHRDHPVDLVVGSANPNVDFTPGDHLHRLFGIPYVMDFRDGWSLDVYTGDRTMAPRSREGRTESRLLRQAVEAWFVNQPIQQWYQREYPEVAENFHVVSNGWDPDFLRLPPPREERGDRPLTFAYLGTIYGPMPLHEALEGWRRARSESTVLANARLIFRGRLGHFAEPDPRAAALLERYKEHGVSYEGPVSKTEVSQIYSAVDALLLIVSHSPFVTSGKVFEYAATGLPIAAVHHPDTAATSVLRGRPGWFPVADLSINEVAESFKRAADHALSMTTTDHLEARAWARPLARDEQLVPRIHALAQRVRGGP